MSSTLEFILEPCIIHSDVRILAISSDAKGAKST